MKLKEGIDLEVLRGYGFKPIALDENLPSKNPPKWRDDFTDEEIKHFINQESKLKELDKKFNEDFFVVEDFSTLSSHKGKWAMICIFIAQEDAHYLFFDEGFLNVQGAYGQAFNSFAELPDEIFRMFADGVLVFNN